MRLGCRWLWSLCLSAGRTLDEGQSPCCVFSYYGKNDPIERPDLLSRPPSTPPRAIDPHPNPTHFHFFISKTSSCLLSARAQPPQQHTTPKQDWRMVDDQRPTASKSRPSMRVSQRNPRRLVRRSVQRPSTLFLDSDSGSGGSAPRQQETSHRSQAQSPPYQTQIPTPQKATSLDRLQAIHIPMGVPLREIGLANPRRDFAARRRNHEMEMHPDLLFDDFLGEGKSSGT